MSPSARRIVTITARILGLIGPSIIAAFVAKEMLPMTDHSFLKALIGLKIWSPLVNIGLALSIGVSIGRRGFWIGSIAGTCLFTAIWYFVEIREPQTIDIYIVESVEPQPCEKICTVNLRYGKQTFPVQWSSGYVTYHHVSPGDEYQCGPALVGMIACR